MNRTYIKVYINRKLERLLNSASENIYKNFSENNLMTSWLLEKLKVSNFFFKIKFSTLRLNSLHNNSRDSLKWIENVGNPIPN